MYKEQEVEQALGNLPSEDTNAITGEIEADTTDTGHIDINATIPEPINRSNVEITPEVLKKDVRK